MVDDLLIAWCRLEGGETLMSEARYSDILQKLQPHRIGDDLLIAWCRLEGGETLMSEASYSDVLQ